MAALVSRHRRSHGPASVVAGLLLLFLLCHARESKAQLHWDASAQVGAMKRFLVNRPANADDAGFGPTAQLTAHLALLPLVHVGAYLGADLSPLGGDAAARKLAFGGVRARGMLPWVRGTVRAWIFAGFGYSGVYAPSYETTFTITDAAGGSTRRPVYVQGAGGGFFEVPLGIGASYRFFKPWELCAELGARFGFGHTGTAYEHPGPGVRVADLPPQNAAPAGFDRFALGLTLGILLDL